MQELTSKMIKYFQSNYISRTAKKKNTIFHGQRDDQQVEVLVAKPDDPSSFPESDMAEVDFHIIPGKNPRLGY